MSVIQSAVPSLALSGGTVTGASTFSNGLTVTAGGLLVSAGGITETDGGFTSPLMHLLATTSPTPYTLVNGTGTIFTWTAPNDGLIHRVFLLSIKHVTSNETGGAVTGSMTLPDGTASSPTIFGGGSATGGVQGNYCARQMQAGTVFTLSQSSALTVGASVMWAELWGS